MARFPCRMVFASLMVVFCLLLPVYCSNGFENLSDWSVYADLAVDPSQRTLNSPGRWSEPMFPPATGSAQMVYLPETPYVMLYAGWDYGRIFTTTNFTYLFNVETHLWSYVWTALPPGDRQQHRMVVVSRNDEYEVVMFGGYSDNRGMIPLDDMAIFDVGQLNWRYVEEHGSLTVTGLDSITAVWGGFDASFSVGDPLYTCDRVANANISCRSNVTFGMIPDDRMSGATWTDFSGTKEHMWLFGGWCVQCSSICNDVYRLDMPTLSWDKFGAGTCSSSADPTFAEYHAIGSMRPGARLNHQVAKLGDSAIVLSGGVGFTEAGSTIGGLADLWRFNFLESELLLNYEGWHFMKINGSEELPSEIYVSPSYATPYVFPGDRVYHSLVSYEDADSYKILMFGFADEASYEGRNDIFELSYSLQYCGIYSHLSAAVCGGLGECTSDGCLCYDPRYGGDSCMAPYCFSGLGRAGCNDRGICESYGVCVCDDYDLWGGEECDQPVCGDAGCNGFVCSEDHVCECENGYEGAHCEIVPQSILGTIIGGAVGGVVGLLFVLFLIVIVTVVVVVVLRSRKHHPTGTELPDDPQTDGLPKFVMKKDLFTIPFNEVKLIEEIGSGGGGARIYRANWNSMTVAFKVFQCSTLNDEEDFADFERELMLHSSLQHPHVLRFYGASLQSPRFGILMSFAENGDMRAYLLSHKANVTVETRLRFLREVALAMEFLHARSVIHRDLKCQNVLIDENLTCLLMDFGLSRVMGRLMTRRIGTPMYMAPELILGGTGGESYDHKVDVFAFGIMMHVLCRLSFRPYGEDSEGMEFRVANDAAVRPEVLPSDVETWGEEFCEMMQSAWKHDSRERPEFSEIVVKLAALQKKRNPATYVGKEKAKDE